MARFLTSPVMCVLWAALLFLDWGSLPNDSAASTVAARQRPFSRLISLPTYGGFESCPPPWPTDPPSAPPASYVVDPYRTSLPKWNAARYRDFAEYGIFFHVYRTPKGIVALDQRTGVPREPGWQSIDWPSVHGDRGVRYTGFWAPTSAVHRLYVAAVPNAFTPAELGQLPQAIFQTVARFRDEPYKHPVVYWLLHAARAPRTVILPPGHPSGALAVSITPVPWGYAHNGMAAMLALLFLAALLRTCRRAVVRFSRRANLTRGHCPACDYDLTFAFDNGCPECGWNRRADPPSHHASGPLKST